MQTKEVIINGKKVSYVQYGTGSKPVVLLHGWADKAQTFQSLMSSLGSQYVMYALDLPGFGVSEMRDEPMGLDDFVEVVSGFIDKVVGKKPHTIIGHSNGGSIAIKGIATNRLHAKKLVLLASAGVRQKRSGNTVYKLAAKVLKQLFKLLPQSLSHKAKKRLYKAIGSDYFVAGHMKESFKLVVAEDITEAAGSVAVPTLLLYGSDDKQTPPEYGRLYEQAIKGSMYKEIDGAAHMLHQTHSDQVNAMVSDFIGGRS